MMTPECTERGCVEHDIVTHVEFLDECDELYDITVEDNHNFFSGDADSIKLALSHNCAADALHLLLIRQKQILRASHQLIGTKPYTPYFKNHMRHIMGETEHQLSRMRQCGSAVDFKYLKHLISDESPLVKEIQEKEEELKAYDSIQATNATLLDHSGYRGQGLWGAASESSKWMFTPSKPAHRVALFIDQLKLDPVDFTDKGAPAIDKNFIEQYKMNVAEVETYAEHQEIDKLYGTYAKGWVKRLRTTLDGVTDFTLRPDYSYMAVATGRLASYDPSLQVIPQRGRAAKLVKRAFVARKGYILLKFDFSAHEVRFWSIVSGDKVIADTFRKGQKLRQQWILTPTDEIKKKIKTDGDVHIQNVKIFFHKEVDKSDPLRDAVKRAVFGTIYGLGAASLGEQTKAADIVAIKDKIVALRKEKKDCKDPARLKEIDKEVSEQLRMMAKIRAEDREEYAQGIMEKLLKAFPKGAGWLDRMKKQAVEQLHVYSPFGRIRHLYAALIQENQTQSRQVRRAVNAPIQGIASEQGTEGNRAIDKTYYMEAPVIAKELGLDVEHASKLYVQRIVHDASYFMVPIDMVIPLLHIMLHESTYGSRDRVKKHFGLEYTVEPEIEAEFGMDDSNSYKFDFSMKSLVDCIGQSIKDGEKLGLLDCSPKEAMRRAFAPWINKNTRNYLHKQFPLLNVPEAVNVVPDALKMAAQYSFAENPK